jgi:hypothetical protein
MAHNAENAAGSGSGLCGCKYHQLNLKYALPMPGTHIPAKIKFLAMPKN